MADPGVIPMLAYEDGPAALDWLTTAFGFRERMRLIDDGGVLTHGELETDTGVVMLATPSPDYQNPKHHRESCEAARRWSSVPWVIDGVLVYVDDVAEHHARAERAGATMLSGIEETDYGSLYRVEDLDGHRWMFLQPPG